MKRSTLRARRERPRRGSPETAGSFRCVHCRLDVPMDAPGTQHRNHCPGCLWSRHVDDLPGDRDSDCGASMEPIAITVR
ncbi:MAG: RNHCP domain-containing protein, partial [Chloroflexota bacterium]|nr:RNHCP domain-containing protein [Chloroflexota bacterium]